jgi:hypothetical protein
MDSVGVAEGPAVRVQVSSSALNEARTGFYLQGSESGSPTKYEGKIVVYGATGWLRRNRRSHIRSPPMLISITRPLESRMKRTLPREELNPSA